MLGFAHTISKGLEQAAKALGEGFQPSASDPRSEKTPGQTGEQPVDYFTALYPKIVIEKESFINGIWKRGTTVVESKVSLFDAATNERLGKTLPNLAAYLKGHENNPVLNSKFRGRLDGMIREANAMIASGSPDRAVLTSKLDRIESYARDLVAYAGQKGREQALVEFWNQKTPGWEKARESVVERRFQEVLRNDPYGAEMADLTEVNGELRVGGMLVGAAVQESSRRFGPMMRDLIMEVRKEQIGTKEYQAYLKQEVERALVVTGIVNSHEARRLLESGVPGDHAKGYQMIGEIVAKMSAADRANLNTMMEREQTGPIVAVGQPLLPIQGLSDAEITKADCTPTGAAQMAILAKFVNRVHKGKILSSLEKAVAFVRTEDKARAEKLEGELKALYEASPEEMFKGLVQFQYRVQGAAMQVQLVQIEKAAKKLAKNSHGVEASHQALHYVRSARSNLEMANAHFEKGVTKDNAKMFGLYVSLAQRDTESAGKELQLAGKNIEKGADDDFWKGLAITAVAVVASVATAGALAPVAGYLGLGSTGTFLFTTGVSSLAFTTVNTMGQAVVFGKGITAGEVGQNVVWDMAMFAGFGAIMRGIGQLVGKHTGAALEREVGRTFLGQMGRSAEVAAEREAFVSRLTSRGATSEKALEAFECLKGREMLASWSSWQKAAAKYGFTTEAMEGAVSKGKVLLTGAAKEGVALAGELVALASWETFKLFTQASGLVVGEKPDLLQGLDHIWSGKGLWQSLVMVGGLKPVGHLAHKAVASAQAGRVGKMLRLMREDTSRIEKSDMSVLERLRILRVQARRARAIQSMGGKIPAEMQGRLEKVGDRIQSELEGRSIERSSSETGADEAQGKLTPAQKLAYGAAVLFGAAAVVTGNWWLLLGTMTGGMGDGAAARRPSGVDPSRVGLERPPSPRPGDVTSPDFGPHYFKDASFYESLPMGGRFIDGVHYFPILKGIKGQRHVLESGAAIELTGRVFGQGSASTVYEARITRPDGSTQDVAVKIRDHGLADPRNIESEIKLLKTAEFNGLGRVQYLGTAKVEGRTAIVTNVAPGEYYTKADPKWINETTVKEVNGMFDKIEALGLKPGDFQFTIDHQGRVHLMDLEGLHVEGNARPFSRSEALSALRNLRMKAGLSTDFITGSQMENLFGVKEDTYLYRTTRPKQIEGGKLRLNPRSVTMVQDPYKNPELIPDIERSYSDPSAAVELFDGMMEKGIRAPQLDRPGLNVSTNVEEIMDRYKGGPESTRVTIRMRYGDIQNPRIYPDVGGGAGDKGIFYITADGPISVEVYCPVTKTWRRPLDQNIDLARGQYDARKNSPERTELHRSIASQLLQRGSTSEQPYVIFSAGTSGSGKSRVLGALKQAGYLDADKAMLVDPDQIKEMIPEYQALKAIDPSQAAMIVHHESGMIQQEVFDAGLRQKKNMIIDGTLKDHKWFASEFERIRRDYPGYKIIILHVDVSYETALKRAQERAGVTGRHVPEKIVRESSEQVPSSVRKLGALADRVIRINNEGQPVVEGLRKGSQETGVVIPLPHPASRVIVDAIYAAELLFGVVGAIH